MKRTFKQILRYDFCFLKTSKLLGLELINNHQKKFYFIVLWWQKTWG